MAKKTVVTQAWVQVIGSTVTERLSALYGRDFIYQQTGPYYGGAELIGIVFNESALRTINKAKTVFNDRADFRFGFILWREYFADHHQWWTNAGFLVASKAIARQTFSPNLTEMRKEIASKLRNWLEPYKGDAILNFDQKENAKFIWENHGQGIDLEMELMKYGDFDRKSKYSDRPAIVVGTQFNAGRWIPELDGFSEDELVDNAETVSTTLLGVFEGLGFLYELLWPRKIAPPGRPAELDSTSLESDPAAEWCDSDEAVAACEEKYADASPQVREVVSKRIERGAVGSKVKAMNGYKCLICDALGLNPIGFLKRSGEPYIEAHHVTFVSRLLPGTLGRSNIITVCANHHRQLHYGNAELLHNMDGEFVFKIDGVEVRVPKAATRALPSAKTKGRD
jgi:hypothetical protein